MKKSTKKKYQNIKPDGQAYSDLVSEYEREEMWDYSFKNNAQAMGKNAKKIRRLKIVRIVLSVIGAILVVYLGYFIIALIKGVNSRPQTTTAEYVIISEQESTTVPSTDESTSVPVTANPKTGSEKTVTEENEQASTQPGTVPAEDSGL